MTIDDSRRIGRDGHSRAIGDSEGTFYRQRRAEVRGFQITKDRIANYLPENYKVVGSFTDCGQDVVLVEGHDVAGWTLEDYVIPRLASGMWAAKEVEFDG